MYDLIWVGNTLYPRWFVFGVMAVVVLGIIGLIALIGYLVRDEDSPPPPA